MTTEAKEDRLRYLSALEVQYWHAVEQAAVTKDMELLEYMVLEIRATRRQREQLGGRACD